MAKLTKKALKENADVHHYGRVGKIIFYDWKSTPNGNGFKYAVKASNKNATQKKLLDALYKLVVNDEQPPWYIDAQVAKTDAERFKVPIGQRF